MESSESASGLFFPKNMFVPEGQHTVAEPVRNERQMSLSARGSRMSNRSMKRGDSRTHDQKRKDFSTLACQE